MSTRVDDGNDHYTLRFDEIVGGEAALGDQHPTIVIESDRVDFGIEPNPVGGGKISIEETFTCARKTILKIIVGCLNIPPHWVERDDRQTFHERRRTDRFSSAIVTVLISPFA